MKRNPPRASELPVAANKRRLRKLSELSLLIPCLGALFFMTPMIDAFTTRSGTTDPADVARYVFGSWLLLIGAALVISRLLVKQQQDK